jgi:hypothetical protein
VGQRQKPAMFALLEDVIESMVDLLTILIDSVVREKDIFLLFAADANSSSIELAETLSSFFPQATIVNRRINKGHFIDIF